MLDEMLFLKQCVRTLSSSPRAERRDWLAPDEDGTVLTQMLLCSIFLPCLCFFFYKNSKCLRLQCQCVWIIDGSCYICCFVVHGIINCVTNLAQIYFVPPSSSDVYKDLALHPLHLECHHCLE